MSRYLRSALDGVAVALGPKLFRKQLLRLGSWEHPDAPGGRLNVTKEMVTKIIENFRAGVRDDVPVPMGHDLDALQNAGHVVGLDQDPDGSLWGIISFAKDETADDVVAGSITGGSALIALEHRDHETGEQHGPTLVHWALTNAPYIKGLAGYEAVALGERQDGDAVVIALSQEKGRDMDPIQELLAKISEMSDEDLRKELEKAGRIDLFKVEGEGTGTDDEAIEKARAEGAEDKEKELVAALSEKGISIKLGEAEGGEGKGEGKPSVDVTSSPEYVALAEQVSSLVKEKAQAQAESLIDGAIKERKVLPAQREALIEIALSEGGLDRVKKLIPDQAVVSTKELGVSVTDEPGVELSEGDTKAEVTRLLESYGGKAKSES